MGQTVQVRALKRAAKILGDSEALCRHLGVSPRLLERWMQGKERTPDHIFLRVADLLSETAIEALTRTAPGADPQP